MCGIVGAIAQRHVHPILLEGLRRLEYRGYDSAGMAVVNEGELKRLRALGKVAELESLNHETPLTGHLGIAHTRWATHGVPSTDNAHPHVSRDQVAIVHNGIIENHAELREQLLTEGYQFTSQTDTEVVVHLIDKYFNHCEQLLDAVQKTVSVLEGAYALAVVHKACPDKLIVCRKGSPLAIGIGLGEHFIASDVNALLPVTRRFIFLEEGDFAQVELDQVSIYDEQGHAVQREIKESELSGDAVGKGDYRHYMEKEIHEQPTAIANTLEGRLGEDSVLMESFGINAERIFHQTKQVHIIACGTSFHAASVARYWIESLAELPCHVEVASEYRYRKVVVPDNTLFVTISQSGETADTLAALRFAKKNGYLACLSICNVPESSIVREADLTLLTRAGPEIGVASTKAFTTQLTALYLMVLLLAKGHHRLDAQTEARLVGELKNLPGMVVETLKLNSAIEKLSEDFVNKTDALFLARGSLYPIALEGALKLKEISYIHAEGYPAGELKHGPLALVDENMPVIAVAPNNELVEKLTSNLEEVRARGGKLYVFADQSTSMQPQEDIHILRIPACSDELAAVIYTIPLQILSYHVAVLKGTDVDQPRNLAKSVTVE